MKKTFSMVMAFVMLFSLMNTSVFAQRTNAPTDNDKADVESVVQTYLEECAREMFLFEENNSSVRTLNGTALAQTFTIGNTQSELQGLMDFRAKNDTVTFAPTPVALTDFVENLELQEDRVAYLRHINESQGITYDYFNTTYSFWDTVVDGNYATTCVSEVLDYQYSFCDNPTYEQFTYNITLARVNGVWVIVEVISDDPFYIENCTTGFDLDAEVQDYDTAQAMAETEILPEPVDISSIPVPMAVGNVNYIKQNAINYALTYSSSYDDGGSGKPDWANSNMPWMSANCMNFVSQCFWAGLGGSNSSTDISNLYGMDDVGTSTHKWSTYGAGGSSTASWGSCSNFKSYVDNPVSGEKDLICVTKDIASNDNSLFYSADSLKGAAIQTKGSDKDGNPVMLGHVVFINDATGSQRDQVYFTSYNTNWKNKLFSTRYPKTTSVSTIDKLYIIIPSYMRNADDGLRLWADLSNALPSGTSVPIKGYANATCQTIKVQVYNPSGVLMNTQNFTNISSVSTSYVCSGAGAWKIVLTGTNSSGSKSFTYMVRIYS